MTSSGCTAAVHAGDVSTPLALLFITCAPSSCRSGLCHWSCWRTRCAALRCGQKGWCSTAAVVWSAASSPLPPAGHCRGDDPLRPPMLPCHKHIFHPSIQPLEAATTMMRHRGCTERPLSDAAWLVGSSKRDCVSPGAAVAVLVREARWPGNHALSVCSGYYSTSLRSTLPAAIAALRQLESEPHTVAPTRCCCRCC